MNVPADLIAEAFGLPAPVNACVPEGNGLINASYRLVTGGRSCFLQRINTAVFRDPAGLMENFLAVTAYLRLQYAAAGSGLRALTALKKPGADGPEAALYRDTEGGVWRVLEYLPCVSVGIDAEPEELFEVGRAFGDLAAKLAGFDASLLKTTIPDFHNTARYMSRLFADAEKDALGRLKASPSAERLMDFLRDIRWDATSLSLGVSAGLYPLRATHNDTKANNVLLDPESRRAIAVADLDTVMPGFGPYDFGDGVRSAANAAAEDEPDSLKIRFDLARFEAFARGYLPQIREVWTAEEKEACFEAILGMIVELAARFLDDYICGDVYFRTAYPEHNLIRARNQVLLTVDLLRKQGEVRSILASCLDEPSGKEDFSEAHG